MRNDSFASLEAEFLQERARVLGYAADAVEKALDRLRREPIDSPERASLVEAAARRVWCFVVTRESMGLRHNATALAFYGVPAEVLARV